MNHLGKFEVMWTIYFVVVGLLWMIFEKAMGWHDVNIADHATYTNLFGVVATIVVVLYMKAKKKMLGENNNYLNLLIGGCALSLGIAILSPLSMYITFEYITPDFFQNAINYGVENKKATLEQAQEYFNFTNYVMQASLGGLVMGIVTSAIVAIFFRKPIKE